MKGVQFSKLHVVFANFMVLLVYTSSVILALLDKIPVSDVAIAIITAYGGFATAGYFTLSAVRDLSKNKNGITLAEMEVTHGQTNGYTETQQSEVLGGGGGMDNFAADSI